MNYSKRLLHFIKVSIESIFWYKCRITIPQHPHSLLDALTLWCACQWVYKVSWFCTCIHILRADYDEDASTFHFKTDVFHLLYRLFVSVRKNTVKIAQKKRWMSIKMHNRKRVVSTGLRLLLIQWIIRPCRYTNRWLLTHFILSDFSLRWRYALTCRN